MLFSLLVFIVYRVLFSAVYFLLQDKLIFLFSARVFKSILNQLYLIQLAQKISFEVVAVVALIVTFDAVKTYGLCRLLGGETVDSEMNFFFFCL